MGREIARAHDVQVDQLDRERLTSIIADLNIKLRILLDAATDPAADWTHTVARPLRGSMQALADDVARRQMKLDRLHEMIMAGVVERLAGDWQEALAECQEVLRSATSVARELCETLLTDANEALNAIDLLVEPIREHDEMLLPTIEQLRNEIERLRLWADDRLIRWTAYHRRVGNYVGTLVRLDPDRIVAGRLRSLLPYLGRTIADSGRAPHTFTVTQSLPHVALRNLAPAEIAGEVIVEPNELTVSQQDDHLAPVKEDLKQRARDILSRDGAVTLHALLDTIGEVPETDHNEICEWAVRHLATLGPFVRVGTQTEWPALSLRLAAVQPLTVVQSEPQ